MTVRPDSVPLIGTECPSRQRVSIRSAVAAEDVAQIRRAEACRINIHEIKGADVRRPDCLGSLEVFRLE